MTQTLSPALANLVAQTVSASVANGSLNFYAGDPTAGGVLLGSGQLPIAPFGAPVNGVISMAGQWFATMTAAGTVTHARISDPTGTYWFIATVGLAGSGANIIVSAAAVTVGQVISLTAFTYTVP